jgi:hypothetical protein
MGKRVFEDGAIVRVFEELAPSRHLVADLNERPIDPPHFIRAGHYNGLHLAVDAQFADRLSN